MPWTSTSKRATLGAHHVGYDHLPPDVGDVDASMHEVRRQPRAEQVHVAGGPVEIGNGIGGEYGNERRFARNRLRASDSARRQQGKGDNRGDTVFASNVMAQSEFRRFPCARQAVCRHHSMEGRGRACMDDSARVIRFKHCGEAPHWRQSAIDPDNRPSAASSHGERGGERSGYMLDRSRP